MVVCVASATTVNLNWTVDNTNYAQTTCESGNNLSLPTPPTKYGYTFKGWNWVDTEIVGTVTQTGTPTPENPIEPVFYENNGLILRAIGNVADSYSTSTGKITRRIGVKIFDGTENWLYTQGVVASRISIRIPDSQNQWGRALSSHFVSVDTHGSTITNGRMSFDGSVYLCNTDCANLTEYKTFLAEQYANGTPVTVYYPLATPVEEIWNGQNN